MAMTIVEAARPVITGGVDTHRDVHVAAAARSAGWTARHGELLHRLAAGYKALLGWLEAFGDVTKVGVEGTGSYGSGLARLPAPRRASRCSRSTGRIARSAGGAGKSDPLDAIEAARAALSGRATGKPKAEDGDVEAIRVLVVAKRSARQARVKALVQMRHLGYTAPDQLRCRSRASRCQHWSTEGERASSDSLPRPGDGGDQGIVSSTALAGRSASSMTARRARPVHRAAPLRTAPTLLELFGVGPDTAAATLSWRPATTPSACTQRRPGPTCAVCRRFQPARASQRPGHRHDPGGDRQANSALWRIVMVRLACDPETQAYFERRSKEGRTKREVVRILKRYLAREVYRLLPRR